MSSRLRAAIATTLELLFSIGVVASLAVLFAGHIVVAGLRVSSAAPAVLVVLLCGALRMVIARRTPFLFWRRTPQDLDHVASTFFRSLTASGEEAGRWAGWRLVVLLAAVSFLLKAANAWYYRGFFSGDDVEILEWVLSHLQGWQYSPWALRNPFFPFSFLFPPLWAAHRLGLHDTWSLVFLARLCVALCSSVAVIFAYLIGRNLSGSRAGGTFVAASVAIGGFFIRFSSGVLPRAVAAALLTAVVWLLLDERRPRLGSVVGGAVVGVVAAVRFSGLIFVPAGAVGLAQRRRWVGTAAFVLTAVLVAAAAAAGFDLMFRGDPVASTRAILRYTLIEGASTRGVQPWYSYLEYVLQILTPIGLVFACWAVRRKYAVLWTWCAVPVVLLSLLPHKEVRYLTAVMPLLMILLALGALEVMSRQVEGIEAYRARRWWSPAVVTVLLLCLVFLQLDAARFRRSSAPVVAAQWIDAHWAGETVALEQPWRAGDRLYLPKPARIVGLEPPQSADVRGRLGEVLARPDVGFLGLRARTLARPGVRTAVVNAGFAPVDLGPGGREDYRLFVRPAR